MARALLPVLLAILMAVPTTAAPAPQVAALQVQSVATPDAVRIDASVLGFMANGTGVGGTGALSIEASSLETWIDGTRDDAAVLGAPTRPQPYHDHQGPARGTASAVGVRPHYEIFIAALPGQAAAVVQTLGGIAQRPAETQAAPAQRVSRPSNVPIPTIGLREAVAFGATGSTTLLLTGNFTVTLWDWDIETTNKAGTRTYATGDTYTDIGPTPGGIHTVSRHQRAQLTLDIHVGTLRLDLNAARRATLFAGDLTATINGHLTLAGAIGNLAMAEGATFTTPRTVDLDGKLEARMDGAGGRLHVAIAGQARALTVDGKPLAVAAVALEGPNAWTTVLLASGLALAVGLAVWWLGNRLASRRLEALERAMLRADYPTAEAMFRPLLRRRRHQAHALLMGTIALIRLGRVADAQRLLERPALWQRSGPGIHDYLRAHVEATRGRWDEAATALASALREAPVLSQEIATNPAFAPLMARPDLRRRLDLHLPEGYA